MKCIYKIKASLLLVTLFMSTASIADNNKRIHYASEKLIDRFYFRMGGAYRGYFSKIKANGRSARPKPSDGVEVGLGYSFLEHPLNFELGFSHNHFHASYGNAILKTESDIFTINMIQDLYLPKSFLDKRPFFNKILPYFLAGFVIAEHNDTRYSPDGSEFTTLPRKRESLLFNIGVGIKIKWDKPVTLDFGIKFIDCGKVSVPVKDASAKKAASVRAYQGSIGVIINF